MAESIPAAVLPADLRACLNEAADRRHPGTQPDPETVALAAQLAALGLCADISTATDGMPRRAPEWQHAVCVLRPDHLDCHDSGRSLWSLDRAELERRAEMFRARVAELEADLRLSRSRADQFEAAAGGALKEFGDVSRERARADAAEAAVARERAHADLLTRGDEQG